MTTMTDDMLTQEEYDAIEPEPLSGDRIAEMVEYATNPAFRDLYHRCRDAERALNEVESELVRVRHLGWLAWCGWVNRKSDFAARMGRLKDAVEPKTTPNGATDR